MAKYGTAYQRARAELLKDSPWCAYSGCSSPATVADHQPPLALHQHVEGSKCCVLIPSCKKHSHEQAGQVSKMVQKVDKAAEVVPDPPATLFDDWDADWLVDLLEPPESAVMPRFCTVPHPLAVGSYGKEVERHAIELGIELRWWQAFVTRMLLQHDEDGDLLVNSALVTVRRQQGKSTWLRALCRWRFEQWDRFGQQQDVLLASRQLKSARAIIYPAYDQIVKENRESDDPQYRCSRAFGLYRIEHRATNSQWAMMSTKAIIGEPGSQVTLDETWDMTAQTVDEDIVPTLSSRDSSQLILTSTAHRKTTSLMPGRRREALELLEHPEEGVLIVEWSAPRDADIGAEETWRQASPHWTKTTKRHMRDAYRRAVQGVGVGNDEPDPIMGFETQWLNRWPAVSTRSQGTSEVYLSMDLWSDLKTTMDRHRFQKVVVAVEDYHGAGVGLVGIGKTDDDRFVLSPSTFTSRGLMFDWLQNNLQKGIPVLAGVTLSQDPNLRAIVQDVRPAGVTETKMALPVFRQLVNERLVLHVDDRDMDRQLSDFRIRRGYGGQLSIASKGRDDLIRCAAWGVFSIYQDKFLRPEVH